MPEMRDEHDSDRIWHEWQPVIWVVEARHRELREAEQWSDATLTSETATVLRPTKEGLELPDIEAAQQEAALSLADLARDAVRILRRNDHLMQIEVRDDNGRVLQAKFVFAPDWRK
jgi:hypothetical protein